MPSTELLISFFLAAAVFAYMPGPAMLYAIARSLGNGQRAGWMAALGIHIGGYVHVVATVCGVAILFQTVPTIYFLFKMVGAGYLIWLGLKLFLSDISDAAATDNNRTRSAKHAFAESVAVEVFNPKTALFFFAFLPQFADPGAALPIWLQLLILGTIVNIMFSSADVLCVVFASRISTFLSRSASSGRLARRLGGGLLMGLGVNLALSKG